MRYNLALHERLPDSLAAQYSELLRHAVRPTPDGSNLSFKAKRVRGRTYWYLYVSLGRRRTEHYLGAETPALLDTIARERDLWSATADDRDVRARLVSVLLAGGAMPTAGDEAKVLRLLERGGVFLAGGVLVGTIAFRAYANLLGVVWASDATTRDVDLADDSSVPVASSCRRRRAVDREPRPGRRQSGGRISRVGRSMPCAGTSSPKPASAPPAESSRPVPKFAAR